MNSTVEMIALNFKNIETLNIAETNVTVLAEGHWNVALTECLLRDSGSARVVVLIQRALTLFLV